MNEMIEHQLYEFTDSDSILVRPVSRSFLSSLMYDNVQHPLPTTYRYKLCGDFDHIREVMDIFDRENGGYIFDKKIHSVENRDNMYDTELEFSSYSELECLQELVNRCQFPDDMALNPLGKTN